MPAPSASIPICKTPTAPLPEGEYQDPFDFMRAYDLDFPYEYLQNWVDYYTGQTDTLGLPPLANDE